jgi:hypothetical protein
VTNEQLAHYEVMFERMDDNIAVIAEAHSDLVRGQRHLEASVDELSLNVEHIKLEMGVLKSDVGTLKDDVGALKTDVSLIVDRIGTIETRVGAIEHHVGLNGSGRATRRPRRH